MDDKINIKFRNLSYTAERGVFKKTRKQVLKNISGEFKACELTAVVGPSGCGKSSLLNVLSGYIVRTHASGVIQSNWGRTAKRSFIMQEENLHKLLTVKESMMFSMNLKTGFEKSASEKRSKVREILEELGLQQRTETFVGNLSGGQQKRLSIALELVGDPIVLFLDEPTTGLDSSSSAQCVHLLKKLAREGKTVICTIHTPSALVFKMFDHLYAMSDGRCIYQGSSQNLVKFLSENGLKCPESYNPSDFLMEIANGDYGAHNERLTERIENGCNENYRQAEVTFKDSQLELDTPTGSRTSFITHEVTSFVNQLYQLMLRNFLILYRDKSVMWLRLFIHISVSVLVGAVFENSGGEASKIFSIFKLIYAMTIFLMYTAFYSMVTRFSLDAAIIKREHFNRWYSTPAYYSALSLTDIPLTAACTVIFVTILYVMSDLPNDEFRFTAFLTVQVLLSFVAQGFGMMIGSLFTLMGALLFAAVLLPVIVLFGGVVVTRKDANVLFHWVFDICFVKHAGDASISSILGYNRTKLACEDTVYCHFQQPKKFLDAIGVFDTILPESIIMLVLFLIVFRGVAFYMINYRLKH